MDDRNTHRPAAILARWSAALAAVLAALVLLPLLGHRPLTDWDEGIYAEIAREMLATHTLPGFLVPHWNGYLWFEKPPLQMWLTAGSLRLFGLNAFAARLPSALAGVAIVATLHFWLQRRRNELTAWLSTLILLSAFGFQHAARVGETDTLLSLFSLIAVLGLAEVFLDNPKGWLLFFAGFALGLMTKGAASVALPLTALALGALDHRKMFHYAGTFTAGLLLFVAITAPWHAYVYSRFSHAFLHDYIGIHTLTRATTAIEGHHTHLWFYLWVLLVSAPPFALLYPFAIAAALRRRAKHSEPSNPLHALAVYSLVLFAFFTAASTRLPHYIAPAYAALSALTGALIAQWLKRSLRPQRAFLVASAALILFVAAALLTAKTRKTLHNPDLGNGYSTPDNRESVALLQQLSRTSTPLPGGPLLVWRQSPIVPVTTDAFYAHRLAQQVAFDSPPSNLPPNLYFNQPQPFTNFFSTPHLLLLDRALISQLPADATLSPLATGPTQQLAILSEAPAGKGEFRTRVDPNRRLQ